MSRCYLDHITVTAPTLAAGVAWVERTLGAAMRPGGEHPRMGTHNALLELGEKLYLEVIAVNPEAAKPDRPRWFDLDAPDPARPVRLAAWIARSENIRVTAAASPVPLGEIGSMSRGSLEWLITVPRDGRPPMDGILPALIQWPEGVHPADTLPASGCRLVRLEGFHAEADKARGVLQAIGFEGEYSVTAPAAGGRAGLLAHIQTPGGVRRLDFPG